MNYQDNSLGAHHKKALRLVRLIELLKQKPWAAQQLADELGTEKRAVNYYLKDLKDLESLLGFKLLHDEIRHTYELEAGVMLSDIEKVVTHMALRMLYYHSPGHNKQYQEAMLKLAQRLPEQARGIAIESTADLSFREASLEGSNLEQVAKAWFKQQVLEFHYLLPGAAKPYRFELEIYFIEVSRANMSVYVIGQDRLNHRLRTFKLGRMQFVRPIGVTGAYRVPDQFDPEVYLSNAWGIVGSENPVTVKLKFSPAAVSRIREGGYPNLKEVGQEGDGSILVDIAVGTDEDGFPLELLPWIQSWGPRVEVLEPLSLRERWLEEAQAVVEKYGGDGGSNPPDNQYWAHTPRKDDPERKPHLLTEHTLAVAQQASFFARSYGSELAYWLGIYHDFGKVNPAFQKYLKTGASKSDSVPHAIWGASLLYAQLKPKHIWQVSLPILGHHAGLHDSGTASSEIEHFRQKTPTADAQMKAFSLMLQHPKNKPSLKIPDFKEAPFYKELWIRMVFSALVDADYLDTEGHFDPQKSQSRGNWPTISELWERFGPGRVLYLEQSKKDSSPEVTRVRAEVYRACFDKAGTRAKNGNNVFRLTVPTGGGKTLSGLAFALKHAKENGLERVIFAIPYTSITTQTAKVYREVLGEDSILEHHSAIPIPDDAKDRQDTDLLRRQLAGENWDAHLIVTTTVQLFESLLARKPSKCRKLHNLTNSVIVLDEAQTLPPELLKPTLNVLKLLVDHFGVSVVFCTATQPAFAESQYLEDFKDKKPIEIVENYAEHFELLRRVEYIRHSGRPEWRELAEEIVSLPQKQVLVVLNSRKNALALLEAIQATEGAKREDIFHLSTLLCGAHRQKVLDEINHRLSDKAKLPVILVSTQVVEAGVDFDFPVVYRAMGPLDRIVQAAGRCNREGNLKNEKGKVVIFEPAEGTAPSGPYKIGTEKARFILQQHDLEALHKPTIYTDYFRRLFDDVNTDKPKIQASREDLNYEQVAHDYRFIEDTFSIVVPYEDALEHLKKWQSWPSRKTWQRLQPYLVNLMPQEVMRLKEWLEEISEGFYLWKGGYDDQQHRGITEAIYDPSDLFIG